jgi:hypothetical protein
MKSTFKLWAIVGVTAVALAGLVAVVVVYRMEIILGAACMLGNCI